MNVLVIGKDNRDDVCRVWHLATVSVEGLNENIRARDTAFPEPPSMKSTEDTLGHPALISQQHWHEDRKLVVAEGSQVTVIL